MAREFVVGPDEDAAAWAEYKRVMAEIAQLRAIEEAARALEPLLYDTHIPEWIECLICDGVAGQHDNDCAAVALRAALAAKEDDHATD